jgi:transposase
MAAVKISDSIVTNHTRPVAEPHLPPSNNAAEQALRHRVISRRISHGTRSSAASRAYAVLASIIETCRRRGTSP